MFTNDANKDKKENQKEKTQCDMKKFFSTGERRHILSSVQNSVIVAELWTAFGT